MDIGSILLILGILVVVALYISQPLMNRHSTAVSEHDHEYSMLLAERDRILNALQELDFDNILGKIPEDSYPAQRTELLQRGAAILQQLDEHFDPETADDMGVQLEAILDTHREDTAGSEHPSSDDKLEATIASRRRAQKSRSGGFCPHCGHALKQSDRFCSKCGNSIN